MEHIPNTDTLDTVDDLISDIHQLIDDKKAESEPTPEQVTEQIDLPEDLLEEAPAAEAPAEAVEEVPQEEPPAQEFQQQRWTDRQKVPKHVAKLQNNQQEAYAQWLREQEEKGQEEPLEFEEEKPKKKKKVKEQPVEEDAPVVVKTKGKRHVFLWIGIVMILLTVVAAAAAAFLLPQRPEAAGSGVHAEGACAVLLAGTDESLGRTDMLMLLMMDTGKGNMSLLSLPRDTIVSYEEEPVILGSVYGRAGGGEEGLQALSSAVKDCVGYAPDGILVLHPQAVTAFINVLDKNQDADRTLRTLRIREEDEDLDLSREDAQRQILVELIARCHDLEAVLKAPRLMDALQKNSVTDLTARELLWLAKATLFVDAAQAQRAVLPGESDGNVYWLDAAAVVEQINKNCNPYVRAVSESDLNILTVPE